MSADLFDQSAVRSNQSGEITRDQRSLLKGKYSTMPGWFTLGLMAALFALAYVVAGDVLTSSTVLGIGALVGIILVAVMITSFFGNILAAGRMSRLDVEPAPGQIVWKNNHYVAESGGRRLEPVSYDDMQPGDYTFYMVRGTNWILSAQPAGAASQPAAAMSLEQIRAVVEKPLDFDPAQSPDKAAKRAAELRQVMLQFQSMDHARVSAADIDRFKEMSRSVGVQMNALMAGQGGNMRAMGQAMNQAELPPLDSQGMDQLRRALEQTRLLDQSALDTNRSGRVSAPQRSALMASVTMNILIGVLAVVLGVFVALTGLSDQNWWVVLGAGGFGLLIGVSTLVQARTILADWAGGRARMAEGIISKYTHTNTSGTRSRHPTTYYLEIGKDRFSVSHVAYDALIEGRTYKVYMTPAAKKLLNIEPA